jgi:hypothetical protein
MNDATYVRVLKPIQAADRTYPSGEVVDASGWRLLDRLIEQRYIRQIPPPQDKGKK